MPRYELMYILASSVSDDIVPETTSQIEKFVTDFGGNNTNHELLGKKKLAYQIGKTRNGHYGVIAFNMDGNNVAALDAKIRTQKANIIRHIIVNMDEHLERLEKDRIVQSKMKQRIPEEQRQVQTEASSTPKATATKKAEPSAPVNLDDEIEKALNEEII